MAPARAHNPNDVGSSPAPATTRVAFLLCMVGLEARKMLKIETYSLFQGFEGQNRAFRFSNWVLL